MEREPAMQAPALDGGRDHEAAEEEQVHRVGIGRAGVARRGDAEQREREDRDEGGRGDRDRFADPPDGHERGHGGGAPTGLGHAVGERQQHDRERREGTSDEADPEARERRRGAQGRAW